MADRFAVAREQFASHLDAIVASGRIPVTVGEIANGLRMRGPLPEHVVAITFDDGYDDTAAAIELLCEVGLRATVYVTTGQVGARSMIGLDQLGLLADRPDAVELGAHSVTHPRLDELSVPELEGEVLGSKRQLEQLLGRRVETFSYPHGAYDRRVREAVVAAGFQSAAAVKNALSHRADDPWAIARWTVRSSTGAQQIARVLDGRGAPPAWGHERLRTRGFRAVRRVRRTLGWRVGSGR
ncbi:MAG TPA: polysaccharide deacetylase family protein [Solirubrobacteraceae bacterium]|jgi:peptidoglycan/xylan/chitin deacetylase (PgdA/CDA1 family)|nr:polysaccharide deacetylase family protein [Solirubrobacteraceae bacterium]